ncbi:hypothetical protein FGO68_gene14493 [Halteria grandinella]|uniref:Uncharacterized protein n=1 Tax=Halteria grandinella TaxID=5974 RepID=A0A8J8P797_HALGN|nr:hypothetical protein FGO68_gene14493 [Halteria grandinella]
MPDFDILPLFEESNALIHEYITKEQSVLVVCTAGISRSAAIVMAYLMRHRHMTYDVALQTAKEARIFVQPNVGFQRVLQAYGERYGCELCEFKKKTQWFEQYAKKKFTQQLFRVVICDSCECPMIVYTASHKQSLDTEELLEAFNLCEDVGNDFFGVGRWFIEGKQRRIADHFHWHVRELKMVNDIMAVRLLGQDPQIGESLQEVVESVEMVKGASTGLIERHIGGKRYHIMERSVQRGLAPVPKGTQQILIHSRVRFAYDGFYAVEQYAILMGPGAAKQGMSQASLAPHIVATFHFRLQVIDDSKKKQVDVDHILAKL